MARVAWKEDAIISIETREGIFVLAQMLKSPYLLIYDCFKESNDFDDVNLSDTPMLFCHAVTRQFLKSGNIQKLNLKGIKHENLPKRWISPTAEARKITVWEGTPDEKELIIIGEGGKLIEEDIYRSGMQEAKVIMPSISFSDEETIDKHELTNISIYPEFNERLYLCYKFGKNVDPYKDLVFNRPIPTDYKKYIEIISS